MSIEGSQSLADGNGEKSRGNISDLPTPGFSQGGILNSARAPTPEAPIHMSPQASGMSGPIADYMDNSGGLRAGNQTHELFGEAATSRVIITSDGLRTLFETYQSIDEMKEVFIHQLEDTNGIRTGARTVKFRKRNPSL